MPQCVKCRQFFHPNYCVEDKDMKVCVFCYLKKDKVTIEFDDHNETINKNEAINAYKEYLTKLTKTRKIEHLIKTGSESKIIL